MLNSLKYILTIAEAERKMLYRKAKFWVLGGIGLAGILFFMVVLTIVSIVEEDIPGEFLLEGTDAYLALYFFSYAQAILIIFVASDFRKAEEKAHLEQVMLSRPMTTANWVLGKYFGVVSGVLYLNLFLLVIASIGRTLKALLTGAGFNILPFLKYFGIVTLPSIIFMTALIFFLVSLVRVQSIAMIVALGYFVSILAYFRHKFLGLFDYGAFFAPIFSSDFIGYGDIGPVLWQRLFFTLLGLALIGFSIILYPRLWQSLASKRISTVFAVVFFLSAVGVGYMIFEEHHETKLTGQADFNFQKNWSGKRNCTVSHYDLQIKMAAGNPPIHVESTLKLSNPHDKPLDQIFFALNDGLKVSNVEWSSGGHIPFVHEHQLLVLDFKGRPLQPGFPDSIQISYSGTVNADGFMLDRLPESNGLIDKRDGPWTQDDLSAWLSGDFVVLPAQSGWYPVPGAAAGYDFSSPRPQNFATANITVDSRADLTVVCQGNRVEETIQGGRKLSRFTVSRPVPEFSLNAGPYKRLEHPFKQTRVELYVHEKHLLDYELFSDVADTCYEVVDGILDVFEQVTGLPYPYPKLAIVEVPLQMQVFTSKHGLTNILQQPEVVMLGEVLVARNRFKKEIKDEIEKARERGRDDSPARVKREVFIDIVLNTFFSDRLWRGDTSIYSPLKNYLHYQIDIRDPLLSRALELQFYEECERRLHDLFFPDRWNAALSSFDRMRQNAWGSWTTRRRYGIEIDSLITTFLKTPLSQIRPESDGNLFRANVDFKAPPILQMLRKRVGENEYLSALRNLAASYYGKGVTRGDFLSAIQSAIQKETEDDIENFFSEWFDQATFPGYRITQANAEKLDTGKLNVVYQVSTRVQNGEKGDGFVRVVCKTKNDKIWRSVALGSYEEKEIQFPVNEEPRQIEVIPFFSRNRGQIVKQISIANRIKRGVPIDTTFTVNSTSDSLIFVLDDQDEGFFTPVGAEEKYLRPPSRGQSWWENTNPYAFGKYYFGWRVKSAGSGSYPARWEVQVPRDGDYELSFYFTADRSWYGRNRSRTFNLIITGKEGTFPVEIQPQETADGWFPLGRYSFEEGKLSVVELLDEGSGYLIADAIRWEFIE